MAGTHTSLLFHVVFSTKQRRKLLSADVQQRLGSYLGGIARENDFKALAVGGTDDHVHVLLSLPSQLAISKAVQLIKGGSSKWLSDTFPGMRQFEWQAGYGAFTIGASQVDDTIRYIHKQPQHHQTQSFEDEYRAFLERNGVEFDERYVVD